MYCPNCNLEIEGKFCPECGTKLIENPATKAGVVNLGDANAISGGLHVNASHNVHNEDKSVHNITNITKVERQKTSAEILSDKKSQFLTLCREAYEDLILTNEELAILEAKRLELNLPKDEADEILESVRCLAMRATMKAPLSGIAKIKLKQFSDAILSNNEEFLQKLLDGISILAEKNLNEELQYKCYLVMSALQPEICINKYESSTTNNYWMMYWTYFAYLNTGRFSEAEELLVSITDIFSSYPEENVSILAAAGVLIQNGTDAAQDYLNMITGESSPLLQRFQDALFIVAGFSAESTRTLDFYTQHVLKIWDDADRIERENASAERAEAKEMERIIAEAKLDRRFILSEDGMILLKCFDSYIRTCEIPCCIKEIADNAFFYHNFLKEIILPSSLRIIGEKAFCHTKLESVVIPEGVEKIGDSAFDDCNSLREVVLPSTLKEIGERAFSHTKLESVVIPEGVEKIGDSAFDECESLREVVLPSTLRIIGEEAFSHTKLESVVIPEGVEKIEDSAFWGCESLREVVLPSTLRIIGEYTFRGTKLESVVIPEGVEKIDSWAFDCCEFLKEVVLPSTLKEIGDQAFSDTILEYVTIPEGVEKIGAHAFYRCEFLKNIVLPSTLKEIGIEAFSNTKLESVIIPEGVVKIEESAFAGCKFLENVVLPSTLKEIRAGVFFNTKLSFLEITEDVICENQGRGVEIIRKKTNVQKNVNENIANSLPKHGNKVSIFQLLNIETERNEIDSVKAKKELVSTQIASPDEVSSKNDISSHEKDDTGQNSLVKQKYDTPETIVDGIIANMVGGFENVNVFSKNDKYKVCKYLVTQHEWEIIMGSNPSFEKSPNYPVVDITYQEAEDFVRRVNDIASKKGYEFMIPKDTWQWLGYQKKCAEAFKHLDNPMQRPHVVAFAWCCGDHLHDVGKLKPTCGIYDACGLVYEMCQTKKYNSYHYGAFNEPIDQCFGNKSSELMYVDKRYDNLGLRLICLE